MIHQENIVPAWKSIQLSTCPHPPLRCEAVARSKFHTVVIPAQDDDTELAERYGCFRFEAVNDEAIASQREK